MLDVLENKNIDIDSLDKIVEDMINKFIENHTISKKAHEELIAMSHLDSEIAEIFTKKELDMTNKINCILENNGLRLENSIEKIHIIIGIVDNLCHEIVYHKHSQLNYDIMTNICINTIVNIFNNNHL